MSRTQNKLFIQIFISIMLQRQLSHLLQWQVLTFGKSHLSETAINADKTDIQESHKCTICNAGCNSVEQHFLLKYIFNIC